MLIATQLPKKLNLLLEVSISFSQKKNPLVKREL